MVNNIVPLALSPLNGSGGVSLQPTTPPAGPKSGRPHRIGSQTSAAADLSGTSTPLDDGSILASVPLDAGLNATAPALIDGTSVIATASIAQTLPAGATSQAAATAGTTVSGFTVLASSAASASPYADGSSGAPAGSPLLPNLLAGYAGLPPWAVAGVNYAVGVPAGMTLLNPASISMAGVTVNAASHTVTVKANNVTLNGYDFGLAGGWQVFIPSGVTNTVIENSHFLVGANNLVPIDAASGAGNLTVLNNTMDGGGGSSSAVWALIYYTGAGTFTGEYNSFLNAPSDAIDFSNGTMTTIVKYNLFDNIGTSPGSHPDSVQYNAVNSTNSVVAYNTVYEPNPSGMEGIQLDAQSNSTITNTVIANNVVVAKGPSLTMSYSIAVQQDSGSTNNGVIVNDNYIDFSGAFGPLYPPAGSNLTYVGNVNMSTGVQIASPKGTSTTDVRSVAAAPVIGIEALGATIAISLQMDQAQFVTGSPTLTLNTGGVATYVSGSGTTTLNFAYTVTATDRIVLALAVTGVSLPSGASIRDVEGNAAVLGGAIATFTGLGINPGTSSGVNPTTAADTATTAENQAATVAVLANDTDSGGTINPASVAVSSAAAHGTTSVNTTTGAITYTPASGYFGTDTFQYTVANTIGGVSAPAAVSITVDAPPTTVATTATTTENQAVTVAVLANDTDPVGTINPASVAVSGAAAHGTTSINTSTGAITYTPTAGYVGTDTFQYTVANTIGQVSAPAVVSLTVSAPVTGGSGYVDGASGAPAGTPQVATILTGYAVRPPWEVAGVDYAVGVPAATSLKDPSTISITGVTVSTSAHTVTINGNNVTLDGYDFSLGGYTVIVNGANDTIKNSKFVVGSNQGSLGTVLNVTTSSSNFSLLASEIDGANIGVTSQRGASVMIQSSGTVTLQYDYFHNSGGDMIDFNRSTSPEVDIVQYNLFSNIGGVTAHSDTLQWYNTQIGAGSDIGFNTVYDNVNQSGNGALVPLSEGPQSTMTGLTVNNDTIIQTAKDTQGNFSTGFYADAGGVASNIIIHDMYIDPTGPLAYTGSPWFPTGSLGDNLATPTVLSNVINMVTGTVVPVPSASSKTSQGYYTYADAAGYSPTLSDVYSVTASPPSGTFSAGATITFTINLDENFTVTGTPTLKLNDGDVATYVSGSGTNALMFKYTVASTDTAVSALAVSGVNLPTGVSIKDSVGNAANLAGAIATFSGLSVNPGSSPVPNPTTVADSAVTVENQAVTVAVLANDTDPGGTINPASVAVSTAAAHGTTSINMTTGVITYTPTAGYSGTDTFLYTVANTVGGASSPTAVTVTVEPPRTLVWTGGAGTALNSAGDWNDTTDAKNPALVAPSLVDTAIFTSAVANLTGNTTIAAISMTAADTLQLTAGSKLSSTGALSVGVTGVAQLSVGSTATLTNGSATIANAAAASGSSVNVSGSSADWQVTGTLVIGGGGAGTLSVANGGSVGAGAIDVGQSPGASGNIVVSGSASKIAVAGPLTVGDTGNGALSINAGTVVATGNLLVGNAASLTAGTVSSGNGSISVAASGVLSVGSISLGNTLALSTSTGAIAVTSGGTVLATAGDLEFWRTSGLSLDAASYVEVGTGGTRVAGSVLIDNGAVLDFNNGGLLSGNVIDNGSINVKLSGAKAEITGNLSGNGTVNITSGATLQLDGNVAAGPTVAFASGTPETLILSSPTASVSAPITGFAAGDTIDFSGIRYKNSYAAYWYASATGGTLKVIDTAASNAVVETLTFTGVFSGTAVELGSDGGSGFKISLNPIAAVTPLAGQLVISSVSGSTYTAAQPLIVKGVDAGTRISYLASGQAYGSYNYDFAAGGALIGSEFYYTNIVGQPYTGNVIYYDPTGNVTRTVFTGIAGPSYSAYEYDYVGGVFAGSKFTFTTPPAGASYSSYELDYGPTFNLTGEKFFYANVSGQAYTSMEQDFNGSGQLTRVVMNGFANGSYSSLEQDYSAGTYTGYKAFYTGLSGQFTNVEEDVNTANVVTKVISSGPTNTPYSSVEQDFSGGVETGTVYSFTGVSGQNYYAYHVTDDASGSATQEVFDLNSGGHLIYAFANMQFLRSEGSDTFVGQSYGNDTFVLNPTYGHETFSDFTAHLAGSTHDTIQFSATEFGNFNAMYAATSDTATGAVIAAPNGDMVTLVGVTKAQVLANQGDFTFA